MDVVSIVYMDRAWQLGHAIPDRPGTRIVKFIVGPNTVDVFALPEPLPPQVDKAEFFHEQLMSPTVPIVVSAAPQMEWLETMNRYSADALETVTEVLDLKNQRWVEGQPIPGEAQTVIQKIFSNGERVDVFASLTGSDPSSPQHGWGFVFRLMPLSYQRVSGTSGREKWGVLMTVVAEAAEAAEADDEEDDEEEEDVDEEPAVTAAVNAAARVPPPNGHVPSPPPSAPAATPPATPTPE